MKLTLQLKPEAALELHKNQHDTELTQALLKLATELGLQLEPMHPGVEDEELASYFQVPVENADAAKRVADQLRDLEAVDAAYLKPFDALP